MTKKNKPISAIFASAYLKGAILLLLMYVAIVGTIIHITENNNNEQRLALVAPFHFELFNQGVTGSVKVSPLLDIYDDFSLLPESLQRRLSKDFQGIVSLQFEDDSEFVIYAQQLETPNGMKMAYAVENPSMVEWDDVDFIMFELGLFSMGMLALLVLGAFVRRESNRISTPFVQLANQLERTNDNEFQKLEIDNITSIELEQTMAALNNYRNRISDLINREKSFTRYVSHELRTPMTVVKGSLSVLRKQANPLLEKQINRIHQAVSQMEELTETFLLLARSERRENESCLIDKSFIGGLITNVEPKLAANNTKLDIKFTKPFMLSAEPQLVFAACQNILNNAINSAVDGNVELCISENNISVVDNGVGLNSESRGYEGFGIGLLLVKDICHKYGWQFSLIDNESSVGCTAQICFEVVS